MTRQLPPPHPSRSFADDRDIPTVEQIEKACRAFSLEAIAVARAILRSPYSKDSDRLRAANLIVSNGAGRPGTRPPMEDPTGGLMRVGRGITGLLDAAAAEMAKHGGDEDAFEQAAADMRARHAEPAEPAKADEAPLEPYLHHPQLKGPREC